MGNDRPPEGAATPSSSTSAVTIRTVADHVQLVVQIVLTRSSNTVGLRSIRPGARRHPRELRVIRRAGVEGAHVLVEAQHVPDDGRELGYGRVVRDLQPRPLRPVGHDAHGPRAPADEQHGRELRPVLGDDVRRQMRDAVRQRRPDEVDRLPTRSA